VAVGSLALVVPLAAALPFLPASLWGLAVLDLLAIGFVMDANFYPLVLVAQEALPGRAGFATGVAIGLSVGLGAAITAVLGAVVDSADATTGLHVATALAVAAFVVALPLAERRRAAAALAQP